MSRGWVLSYQWFILKEVNHRDGSFRRRADLVKGSKGPPFRNPNPGLSGTRSTHGKVVAEEGSQRETPNFATIFRATSLAVTRWFDLALDSLSREEPMSL